MKKKIKVQKYNRQQMFNVLQDLSFEVCSMAQDEVELRPAITEFLNPPQLLIYCTQRINDQYVHDKALVKKSKKKTVKRKK